MTPELSVIQMLDKVLEWFTKDYKDLGMDNPIPRQSVPVEWVRQNLEKIYPELNTNHFSEYAPLILDKLEEDGFVKQKNFVYTVTLKGKLFYRDGGYEQQEKDIRRQREDSETDLRLKKRTEVVTAYGSVIAAAGAILLLLWEIHKALCR